MAAPLGNTKACVCVCAIEFVSLELHYIINWANAKFYIK